MSDERQTGNQSMLVEPPERKDRDSDQRTQQKAEQLTHGVYGTIIVTALLVTLEEHGHEADEILAAVLGTAVVLFLAHVYSAILARRVARHRRATLGEIRSLLADNFPVVLAVVVPGAVFALADAGVMSLATAFDVAIAYALVSLFAMGAIYGRTTGHGAPMTLLIGATSAGLGALIILLETLID